MMSQLETDYERFLGVLCFYGIAFQIVFFSSFLCVLIRFVVVRFKSVDNDKNSFRWVRVQFAQTHTHKKLTDRTDKEFSVYCRNTIPYLVRRTFP